MSIKALSKAIAAGQLSCVQLTAYCLKRIAANNNMGRKLNAVGEINPGAFAEAERIDREIKAYGIKSPLHGIPVLLKDNIDVKGMHTTAGSLALQDLTAEEDAYVTRKLREAGALILGKANLSEFAYFMSSKDMPCGYSSLAGQVDHAYVQGGDPSGSSSGSAVAAAARFTPYTIGTETDGSLMSPAIANAIVSIKPTVGLIPGDGILPLSHVQDTAGPMATSVEDIAVVLQVLSAKGKADEYLNALSVDGHGLKVGIYRKDIRDKDAMALNLAKAVLKQAGAEVVEVDIENVFLEEAECLKYEFREDLNAYLAAHNSQCRSLADIIAYNNAHAETCLVHGQDLLEASENCPWSYVQYVQERARLTEEAHRLLDGTLASYGVDCLLSAGNGPQGSIAPICGSPCLTIPAVSQNGDNFDPVSYYLMAGAYQESVLIHAAYILEQALQVQCLPFWVR